VSAVGVGAVRRAALRHDWLDVPNERSSHVQAIPRSGGLAIVGAISLAWAVASVAEPSVRLAALPLAALIIAVVSCVDDLRTIQPGPRFAAHGLAAAILLTSTRGWTAVALPAVGTLVVSGAGIALAALWLVGLTNAYNFMDGIDGIAGGQAVVAGVAWATIGLGLHLSAVALVGALVAAAAGGFLVHNWPPARIFMGDTGAATLGFLFAALPLVAAKSKGLPAGVAERLPLAGLLIVWPFVFDAILTILRRLHGRENVLAAHRSHLYQRLVAAGWTHRQTAGLYVGLATVSATAGVGWALGHDSDVGVAVGSTALAVLAIAALAGVPAVLVTVVARSARQPNRVAP
jgi:UDP-N-acetylmuramyl pentapeptide phosphotransferase/UDP-N-acetylglucosamine-1-phosphate transferase